MPEYVKFTYSFGVTVTAEKTDCPHLVIAPRIDRDGIMDEVALVHTLTGAALPRPLMASVSDLRKLAGAVAHLQWDFTDPKKPSAGVVDGYNAARSAMEFAQGEWIHRDYPDGWRDDPRKTPGDADAMVRWLLDSYVAINDHMGGSGPDRIPADVDGKINPEWIAACREKTDLFGLAYLLSALRRIAPEVADHATAFLAGAWDYGDSLGEWVWEWCQQLDAGEPLRLPAVPSPPPAEGELFGGSVA